MSKRDHDKLQAECFQYTWRTYPQYRRLFWMNLNNAPNARVGAQYKSMGMVKGVPDLSVIAPNSSFNGIEFKVGTDTQKKEQRDFQSKLEACGGKYYIVSTFEDFKYIIKTIYG